MDQLLRQARHPTRSDRAARRRDDDWRTIEAELHVPAAKAQLVCFHHESFEDLLRRDKDAYRIDLCLTPRPQDARASYPEYWGPHRFERIGNVFVVPPRETLRVRSPCNRQASIVCELRPDPIRTWIDKVDSHLRWTSRRLEASLDIPNPNIRKLLLRLTEELRHPGFAGHLLLELIAVQLVIELARFCTAIAEEAPTHGLAPWRLRLIDERLMEVREAPTLTELAGLCGLSVRQLTRAFRACRGCSIGEYAALRRADHAKRLLATGQAVKTIAYSLGFSSPSAFTVAFRRAAGETPHQYRQRALRQEYRPSPAERPRAR